jgi:hypothetical protein
MIHPLSLATDGFISASDIQIAQPVVSNLVRTNATGSVDISVADEALITKVWAVCDFGALSGQVGEKTGSGTLTLDFSGCTPTITLGGLTVTIAAPISKLIFQTRDGAGNFSEFLLEPLCDGIEINEKIVVTDYSRTGTTATFMVAGLAGTSADAGVVVWNSETNTLTGQVITNGMNTITGLNSREQKYSFMPIYHAANGDFIVIPKQFGDVVPPTPALKVLERFTRVHDAE